MQPNTFVRKYRHQAPGDPHVLEYLAAESSSDKSKIQLEILQRHFHIEIVLTFSVFGGTFVFKAVVVIALPPRGSGERAPHFPLSPRPSIQPACDHLCPRSWRGEGHMFVSEVGAGPR